MKNDFKTNVILILCALASCFISLEKSNYIPAIIMVHYIVLMVLLAIIGRDLEPIEKIKIRNGFTMLFIILYMVACIITMKVK